MPWLLLAGLGAWFASKSDLVLPGETEAYGDRVQAWAEETDLDVRRNLSTPSESTRARWFEWMAQWGQWWFSVKGDLVAMNSGGVYDAIERWHQELMTWREALAAERVDLTRGALPVPRPVNPPDDGSSLGDTLTSGALGLGLGLCGAALLLREARR